MTQQRTSFPALVAFLAFFMALNIALGQIVAHAGLPLYLDTIGTVLAGVAFGPLAGIICGGLTLLAWEALLPGMVYWAPVGMAVGAMAALCARLRLFISPPFTILAGFLIALTSTVISAPIRLFAEAPALTGEGVVSGVLIRAGRDVISAVLSSSFLVEMVDKVSVCLLAYALLRLLSSVLGEHARQALSARAGFMHPPTLAVIGGYMALLFLYATFFVTEVISPEPLRYDIVAFEAFQSISSPILQQVCVLLANWGSLAALVCVGVMIYGLFTQD